jgi:putative acetyltransferase
MIIRSESPGDIAGIRFVEEAAFLQSAEADLVDDLRAAGDSVLSLIAVEGETATGHAMFSRLQAPFPALALGPVAVLPDRQRMGVGSRLIREGIARSEAAGWLGIFVLGDPAFYRRFGFRCRQGEWLYLTLCRTASNGLASRTERISDRHGKHPACSRLCKARIGADRSATPGAAIPV